MNEQIETVDGRKVDAGVEEWQLVRFDCGHREVRDRPADDNLFDVCSRCSKAFRVTVQAEAELAVIDGEIVGVLSRASYTLDPTGEEVVSC